MNPPPKIAIVGAGMSGASAAHRLASEALELTVFDKGRQPGGRMSTRSQFERRFDHGAQYLKPHSARSAVLFSAWRKSGWIRTWPARGVELPERQTLDTSSWHVAVPKQSSLVERLLEGVEVQTRTEISAIARTEQGFLLETVGGPQFGPYDSVLVTVPAEQAASLLEPFPELAGLAARVESRPCLATMVIFETPVQTDFEASFINGSPLAWACRDASKPERPNVEAWVLHATEEWSVQHLDTAMEQIAPRMLSAFAQLVPAGLPPVSFCRAHRWRYALPRNPLDLPYRYDTGLKLGLAGDWCSAANADAAYWSGHDLAEALLEALLAGEA